MNSYSSLVLTDFSVEGFILLNLFIAVYYFTASSSKIYTILSLLSVTVVSSFVDLGLYQWQLYLLLMLSILFLALGEKYKLYFSNFGFCFLGLSFSQFIFGNNTRLDMSIANSEMGIWLLGICVLSF